MNKIKAISLVSLVMLFAGYAEAQVALTQTTLSAAVTSTSTRTIQVASTTGISAPSVTSGTSTQLYIDDEILDVEAVSSNFLTVRRGANGTKARTHIAGANVYVELANLGAFIDYSLGGSCISGSYPATPMVDYLDGQTYTCGNIVNGVGQWQIATLQGSQHFPTTSFNSTSYTNATTTFSSVGAFSFPVSANHSYTATCQVVFQGTATTAGPKFEITGPASPTFVLFGVDGGTGVAAYGDGAAVAFSVPVTALGTLGAANTNYVAHLSISLINGVNAGTVNLMAAANGTGTLTIQPGSYCVQQ